MLNLNTSYLSNSNSPFTFVNPMQKINIENRPELLLNSSTIENFPDIVKFGLNFNIGDIYPYIVNNLDSLNDQTCLYLHTSAACCRTPLIEFFLQGKLYLLFDIASRPQFLDNLNKILDDISNLGDFPEYGVIFSPYTILSIIKGLDTLSQQFLLNTIIFNNCDLNCEILKETFLYYTEGTYLYNINDSQILIRNSNFNDLPSYIINAYNNSNPLDYRIISNLSTYRDIKEYNLRYSVNDIFMALEYTPNLRTRWYQEIANLSFGFIRDLFNQGKISTMVEFFHEEKGDIFKAVLQVYTSNEFRADYLIYYICLINSISIDHANTFFSCFTGIQNVENFKLLYFSKLLNYLLINDLDLYNEVTNFLANSAFRDYNKIVGLVELIPDSIDNDSSTEGSNISYNEYLNNEDNNSDSDFDYDSDGNPIIENSEDDAYFSD